MSVEIRICRDQAEFGRALYGIGQYFAAPATDEQLARFTQVLEIASSSVAVKLMLTLAPSFAEAGAVTVTVGAISLIVIDAVLEPVMPAASVALTVIVNALLATPPVL